MKKITLIFLILIVVLSCEKTNKVCNCNNPLEELPWLKELAASFTDCTCRMSIIQATYNEQTVFYPVMNDELCDGIQQIILFDCSGDSLKIYTMEDQTFSNEVTDRSVIFTCKTKL
jgi:hypothetical protein